MNSKYTIATTSAAYREINSIYEYIYYNLYAVSAANKLLDKFYEYMHSLLNNPRMYAEIEKYDEVYRKYRRIPVKNYVILYTIDEKNFTIYISHVYYAKSNYYQNY